MLAPYTYRMLAAADTFDRFARQVIRPSSLFSDTEFVRRDVAETAIVLGVFKAIKQRFVFGAAS